MFLTHAELEDTQSAALGRLLGRLRTNAFWRRASRPAGSLVSTRLSTRFARGCH